MASSENLNFREFEKNLASTWIIILLCHTLLLKPMRKNSNDASIDHNFQKIDWHSEKLEIGKNKIISWK